MTRESFNYVQYGCGWSSPPKWHNFDASPTLRFERIPFIGKLYTRNKARFPDNVRYGDITVGLPIADDSCEAIYCSHVLEHLSLQDFRKALLNTHRKLRAGGTFRLVLPDLNFYAARYLQDKSDRSALTFMRDTGLGVESRAKGGLSFLKFWLGNSQHLWMWDFNGLRAELISAGFINIRRASYGDSSVMNFSAVEQLDRWTDCLGIECQKQNIAPAST